MDLKLVRKIKGLSQQDVSDILGIPVKTIQSWESESRKTPAYTKKLINEKILNMSIDEMKDNLRFIVLNDNNEREYWGTKSECESYAKKIPTYTIVQYSELMKKQDYEKKYNEYIKELNKEEQEETVMVDNKEYKKSDIDFNKKYYGSLSEYTFEALNPQEQKACIEALKTLGYYDVAEHVESLNDWLRDDTISISTCRNKRDVVWILTDTQECCLYIDTLEELSQEEIEEQLL